MIRIINEASSVSNNTLDKYKDLVSTITKILKSLGMTDIDISAEDDDEIRMEIPETFSSKSFMKLCKELGDNDPYIERSFTAGEGKGYIDFQNHEIYVKPYGGIDKWKKK